MTWWQGLITAGAVVTAVIVVVKVAYPMFEFVVDGVRGWPVLRAIAAEFKPNSGSSLRDTIDRIEARQAEQSIHLGNITAQLEQLIARPDRPLRPGGYGTPSGF